MKTTLLTVLLACIMLSSYSSPTLPSEKERNHTTRMARFKPIAERETGVKSSRIMGALDFGAILIRNSAQADSMIVRSFEAKNGSWELFMKEIPFYQGASTIIAEMEQWYFDGMHYAPEIKQKATYDDKGRPTRIEMLYFYGGNWVPYFAFEEQFNDLDEVIFDAMYYYDEDAGEWIMLFGFRAIEEYNQNGALILRIWEDYYYDEWMTLYKEEFILNEQDIIVEIIEYSYEWGDTWEKEYRLVMELCENNMWQQGYAYVWDWYEEEWFPELKYIEFEWFDFSRLLFSHVHVMANADLFDDWDDWKAIEDVEWVNYMRMIAEYHESGLPTLRLIEGWYDDGSEGFWQPDIKMEYAYDHHLNIVYDMFSFYDGSDWEKIYGYRLEIEYHEDGSIKSFIFFATRDEWKDELNPLLHYTYHYGDDSTDAPTVDLPVFDLKVFPNPASHTISFELADHLDNAFIAIISADGRVVQSRNLSGVAGSQLVSLDVSGLNSGIYFVRVQGPAGQQTTRFFKR